MGTNMPDYLKKTLNWVAYYGGTDNPAEDNVPSLPPPPSDSALITPISIPSSGSTFDLTQGCNNAGSSTGNDPGFSNLTGYAYLTSSPTQLSQALKQAFDIIFATGFSFSVTAVSSSRTALDNHLYAASFQPKGDPFWPGSITEYTIDSNGNLQSSPVVNATIPAAGSRTIYTLISGVRTLFNTSLTPKNLGLHDDGSAGQTQRDAIVGFIRGESAYNIEGWRLGDIFHSNPVIIGEPSRFFIDVGFSGVGGFYQANKDRTKVIFVGANDGMLHAFNASTGDEVWGFITNSLLKNLLSMVSTHTYYVDSSPKVADVWFDSNGDNIKSAGEWRTLLVCGLRKGGKTYFALNITDTLNPIYLWEFPKSTDSATLAKVGQSWSEPAIGKVKIEQGTGLVEKWVAFIGGGYDPYDEKKGTETLTGNVFFVVDIMTGEIIKEFSNLFLMRHSFPAPPTTLDTNSDGYVDKVYSGDLGGQMWVFRSEEHTSELQSLS
jgi:type IV pilus assembly protein PilY1